MNSVRYTRAEEVPVTPWLIQGTVYDTQLDAKMAAAKIFSSLTNNGVVVKKVKSGWVCFWWRKK